MAEFQLGMVIKARREELGISQETLADGICSVPTLSRLENGERMPTKNHFEMIVQRLGYSAMSLDFFVDKNDYKIHELKFLIRQEYVAKNFAHAKVLLERLVQFLVEPTNMEKQFVILYRVLLNEQDYTNDQKLEQLETAIQLTCPKYRSNYIPRVLSYDEIILLNNIAVCYNAAGNRDHAISILMMIKEYYDHHIICTEEAIRTQPMILYNLSKYLGLNGRYDECIELCDVGIRIARVTGRCPLLAKTLYNRAWALLRRAHAGDRELAEKTLKQAYYFADAMENSQHAESIRIFYEKSFGVSISV